MTDEQRNRLIQLAADVYDKRQRYERLSILAVPSDPTERKASAIEYEIAQAELEEANRALKKEQNAVIDASVENKTNKKRFVVLDVKEALDSPHTNIYIVYDLKDMQQCGDCFIWCRDAEVEANRLNIEGASEHDKKIYRRPDIQDLWNRTAHTLVPKELAPMKSLVLALAESELERLNK